MHSTLNQRCSIQFYHHLHEQFIFSVKFHFTQRYSFLHCYLTIRAHIKKVEETWNRSYCWLFLTADLQMQLPRIFLNGAKIVVRWLTSAFGMGFPLHTTGIEDDEEKWRRDQNQDWKHETASFCWGTNFHTKPRLYLSQCKSLISY